MKMFGGFVLLAALTAPVLAQSGLRDPTLPPAAFLSGTAAEDEAAGGLRLEGVRHTADGRPEAIINGQSLRVGQQVQGYRLLRIGRHEVTLVQDGRQERLMLSGEVSKKTTTASRAGTMPVRKVDDE